MKFIVLAVAVLSASLSVVGAEPVEREVVPAEQNAALQYWNAWWSLGSDRLQKIGVPESGNELDDEHRAACEAILRIASMEHCHFGDAPDDFITQIPTASRQWLALMRATARLLTSDASDRLELNDEHAAAARIAAVFGVSNHTTQDPTLVSAIVGIVVSDRACAFIKEHEALFNAEAKAEILAGVSRLDEADPFRVARAIRSETAIAAEHWIRQIETGELDLDLLGESSDAALLRGIGEVSENSRAVRLAKARLIKDVIQMRRVCERIAEAWNADDGDDVLQTINEEIARGEHGRFAQIMTGSFSRIRENDFAARKKINALRAWASGETETLEFEQEAKR